ncbi:hypothetical protein TNCT_68821 [Trichonephila clavata]|uniref:Uncharacterized protein n=1 Tax=Trichonephila clavata TaxID=2740835 RepID=A0A8X6L3K9_TRICU|nr:hypothetical protein TNCT_68821 [Trichonephila clavata]
MRRICFLSTTSRWMYWMHLQVKNVFQLLFIIASIKSYDIECRGIDIQDTSYMHDQYFEQQSPHLYRAKVYGDTKSFLNFHRVDSYNCLLLMLSCSVFEAYNARLLFWSSNSLDMSHWRFAYGVWKKMSCLGLCRPL